MGGDAFNWHCDGNTTQANLAWRGNVTFEFAGVRCLSTACPAINSINLNF